MKKGMIGLLMFLALANFSTPARAQAAEGDSAAVTAAVDQFYAALNTMFTGDAGPMKEVWSHADDVTYMGPAGGFQNGWPEIEKVWDDTAALKLGGKVVPEKMEMRIGEDLAYTFNYEVGENFDQNGVRQQVSIRATNIFRNENGQWKMIGHHTDLLPYLEKNSGK